MKGGLPGFCDCHGGSCSAGRDGVGVVYNGNGCRCVNGYSFQVLGGVVHLQDRMGHRATDGTRVISVVLVLKPSSTRSKGSLSRGKESLDAYEVSWRRGERPSLSVKVGLAWLAVALNVTKDLSPALKHLSVNANGSADLTESSADRNKVAATPIEAAWARGEELSGRTEERFTERKERLRPRKVSTDRGKEPLDGNLHVESGASDRHALSSVWGASPDGGVTVRELGRHKRQICRLRGPGRGGARRECKRTSPRGSLQARRSRLQTQQLRLQNPARLGN